MTYLSKKKGLKFVASDDAKREILQKTLLYLANHRNDTRSQIDQHLKELDREWSIERVLEANVASMALGGVLLGAYHNKKWLILSGVASVFMLQHAIQGWCPPVTILRNLGMRTRKEIDMERNALKILKGDFDHIDHTSTTPDIWEALEE